MTRRRTIRTARDSSTSLTRAHPDLSTGTPAAASDDLATRIAVLEQELRRLKSEVASHRVDAASSRRDLFKKVAIAGAGVAVGTAGLAQPASAAHQPEDLGLGIINTTGGLTRADYTGPTTGSPTAFVFQTPSGSSNTGTLYPSALGGWSENTGIPHGVFGYTNRPAGYGVVGFNASSGVGVLAVGAARANLELSAGGAPGWARTVNHNKGELVCDDVGDVWLCTAAGNPGTWRKLGGPATAGQLHLLQPPVRAYDSRSQDGPLTGGRGRVVSLVGQFHQPLAVPYLATAALISLTVDRTVGTGYLSVVAEGTPSFGPDTSNINWYASGQTVAVTTVTTVKAAKVAVSAGGFGSTHFIIDVIGYYQ